ncbi:MAG TPA: hypothetical protein VM221_00225 [Armatimonadota bacterium]|nr:hypothetical protein [Armatimonadota bacterium]
MKKASDSRRGPRAVALKSAAAGFALVIVAVAWGANRSAAPAPASARPAARATVRPVAPAPKADEWRFDAVVERNLFLPPAQQRPPAPPALLPALPPVQPMPVEAFTARAVEQPQWTYAGYATADGDPIAIVVNSATGRAEFVRVGQTLDGAHVSDISADQVQLTRDGVTTALRLSEAFTATPLDAPPQQSRPAAGGQSADRRAAWRARRGAPPGVGTPTGMGDGSDGGQPPPGLIEMLMRNGPPRGPMEGEQP